MTQWWYYLVAIPAAALLCNGIPHFTQGVAGRRFPTPFVGGPPNRDSARNNVLWAIINFAIAGVLLWLIRDGLSDTWLIIELLVVFFAAALATAHIFSSRMPE